MVSVQPGSIVTGKVVRLHDYGAFVELGPDVTGLVHISEVHRDYVENIHAYLTEGEDVQVKVLQIKDDGRIDLSIKRADPDWEEEGQRRSSSKVDKDFNQRLRKFMHQSDMIQGEVRRRRRARQ
ncbi:S1 RNA-binding domain-containing protein [Egibacter rhizosphaerae]|uniref:S1 RNA-binding domain-containing protein n=1 Tax=Egibacter rhizosphaerae TaxID=1670831 RepID=A0A411YJL9_9ACTN|nr:S1 RNA-binding domain-containing protein [Egibacter rhizosphaerae]QBI21401.1 S1 RNA-binding domain-containing protein [Egibacter rhizosphaerae]